MLVDIAVKVADLVAIVKYESVSQGGANDMPMETRRCFISNRVDSVAKIYEQRESTKDDVLEQM